MSARKVAAANNSSDGDIVDRAGSVRRVAFLHVPKCGTALANALLHYACAGLEPTVGFSLDPHRNVSTRFADPDSALHYANRHSYCDTAQFWQQNDGAAIVSWIGHHPLTDNVFRRWRGSIFGVFREPWSHLRSMWAYFGPSWLRVANRSNSTNVIPRDLLSFSARVAGSTVLQVSGQRHGMDCLSHAYDCTHMMPDTRKALDRLGGFAFVGLTTRWRDSMCLFHAMFGGPCLAVELEQYHQTNYRRVPWPPEDVSIEIDLATKLFYSGAVERFQRDWEMHKLTSGLCHYRCPSRP